MGYSIDKKYTPPRRRGGLGVVVAALAFAVLLPAGLILTMHLLGKDEAPPPESAAPSSSLAEQEEPLPEESGEEAGEEPQEPAPTYGLVPESGPVDASYFDDAAFFGDSITNGIAVYSLMGNATVIASTGINPDSALDKAVTIPGREDRVTMIEALRDAAPKKIYIQLGANWVGTKTNISEKTFLSHYRTLLERIRADHPESIIYVQSMFPVSKAYSEGDNGLGLTIDIIKTYNAALEGLVEELGLYYLDVYSALADGEGYLPAEATEEGMHLKPAYYEKWFDYLKSHTAPGPQPPADEE